MIQKALQSVAFDIVGLAFAGAAVYGLVTGQLDASRVGEALGVAGAYLGLRAGSAGQ